MEMPFGKYRGEELEDIPSDYLVWLFFAPRLSPVLRHALRVELLTRGCPEEYLEDDYEPTHQDWLRDIQRHMRAISHG